MIDTTTLDESTFSLTYPAPAQVIGSNHLISGDPAPSAVPITGTWSFSTNSGNQTVAVFTPDKPFQQNTLYTAMLLGSDAALTSSVIKNPAGESMAVSYSWGFTTGVLNLQTPPPVNQVSSSCRNQNPSRAAAKGDSAERRHMPEGGCFNQVCCLSFVEHTTLAQRATKGPPVRCFSGASGTAVYFLWTGPILDSEFLTDFAAPNTGEMPFPCLALILTQ